MTYFYLDDVRKPYPDRLIIKTITEVCLRLKYGFKNNIEGEKPSRQGQRDLKALLIVSTDIYYHQPVLLIVYCLTRA